MPKKFEKVPKEYQGEDPREREFEIQLLLHKLRGFREFFEANRDLDDEWQELEVEAEIGTDPMAVREKLKRFLEKIQDLQESK